MSDSGERNIHDGGREAFPSALQRLKQRGCSLLVVGKAPDSVYQAAAKQMLGDSTHSQRRRLFVATDRDVSTARSILNQQADPTTGKILAVNSEARHATAHSQSAETPVPVEHVAGSDLTDLGIAISGAIGEFEDHVSELEPAELRVCLDSLVPLVDHGRKPLFRFLDILNNRIKSISGMGHVHLPIERECELVRLFEPLFDVLIELRMQETEPQQRWYIKDRDVCSGWITLE